MTEQEAVKIIKRLNFCGLCTTGPCGNCERKQAKDTVRSALEEIQQYRTIGTVEEITVDLAEYRDLCKPEEIAHMKSLKRIIQRNGTIGKALDEGAEYEAIGTVEECREAREKQIPKEIIPDGAFGKCPCCGEPFNSELIGEYEMRFCIWCGQALASDTKPAAGL
ncbi:MAG: hypothetical protein HFH87_08095 [Lachnospiraceae bacterium]|nr:hypothetical protein [Lachnospiraceae bacterium]